MNTDTAILMLIADQQRLIEQLRAQNAALIAQLEKERDKEDQSTS